MISLLFAAFVAGGAIGQVDPPATPDRQQRELAYHGETLRNATTSADSRAYAAQLLVRMQTPAAVTILDEALRTGAPDLVTAVIRGLEAEGAAPPGLLEPVALTLKGANPQRVQSVATILARYGEQGSMKVAEFALDATNDAAVRLGAIRALAAFGTSATVRPCVDALIKLIQPERQEPQPILDASFESLVRLTSLGNFGRDAEAWSEWWALMHAQPVNAWLPEEVVRLNQQLESLVQQAETIRAENDLLTRKLDEVLRDLYFRLIDLDPTRQRAMAQLALWAADDVDSVRRWAVTRSDRVVSDAQPLSEEVTRAMVSRLEDGEPDIRLAAARLLHKMNHPDAAGLLAAALARETVLDNRLGLLEVLGRRPAPMAVDVLTTMLTEAPTRDGAAAAIVRIAAENLLPPEGRPAIHAAARAGFDQNISRPIVRLLAAVAQPEDLHDIAALLDHADPAMRTCAAECLRPHPGAMDAIVDRANDESIFPSAVHVLSNAEATPATFDRLVRLVPSTVELHRVWREGLARLGARLELNDVINANLALERLPEERLPAADGVVLREGIAARILNSPSDGLPEETRLSLLLSLARLRSQLGQHEGVLAALDRMNGAGNGFAEDALELRFDTLLRIARWDAAGAIHAEPGPWIVSLERMLAIDVRGAALVKSEIERRFPTLDANLQEQLRSIASRLPRDEPPIDGTGEGGGGNETVTDSGGSGPGGTNPE